MQIGARTIAETVWPTANRFVWGRFSAPAFAGTPRLAETFGLRLAIAAVALLKTALAVALTFAANLRLAHNLEAAR